MKTAPLYTTVHHFTLSSLLLQLDSLAYGEFSFLEGYLHICRHQNNSNEQQIHPHVQRFKDSKTEFIT
jgi:hypothetical protein